MCDACCPGRRGDAGHGYAVREGSPYDRIVAVRTDTGWGYVDLETGQLAIEPVSDGRAQFRNRDGWVGYLDVHGRVAIAPRFEQAAPFRGGLALVVEDGGKSYGYVNRDGQTVYSFPRVPKDVPED